MTSSTTTHGTLQVFDSATGELVQMVSAERLLAAAGVHDPLTADTVDLAQFDENARELKRIADEARGITSNELVRRLDRDGKWTLRTGSYEIRSASPEAGTTAYDTEKLRAALTSLVLNDVISVEGSEAALEPLTQIAPVSYQLLEQIRDGLLGNLDEPDERDVKEAVASLLRDRPGPAFRQKPAGIKALLKVPAARDAIAECRIAVEPPQRKATVKRVVR